MIPPHLDEKLAGHKLVQDGATVAFDIVKEEITTTPGGGDTVVEIELHLGEVEEPDPEFPDDEPYRSEDHEWGGLGFLFTLMVLSFHDARPRGVSGNWYEDDDEYRVSDFVQGLKYQRGELHVSGDDIRGRCIKTDIVLRPDGKVTLKTWTRGEAATRWIRKLKGEKTLGVVEG